jgi:hypothetical protein
MGSYWTGIQWKIVFPVHTSSILHGGGGGRRRRCYSFKNLLRVFWYLCWCNIQAPMYLKLWMILKTFLNLCTYSWEWALTSLVILTKNYFTKQDSAVSNLIFQNFNNWGISLQSALLVLCVGNSNPMVERGVQFSTISANVNKIFLSFFG